MRVVVKVNHGVVVVVAVVLLLEKEWAAMAEEYVAYFCFYF
jgi:hypothetical protein